MNTEDIKTTYQMESFADFKRDFITELDKLHFEELALDHEAVPLDPDYDRYFALESSGNLFVMTVRKGTTLIGYFLGLITPHLHYKSTLHFMTDIYYLRPEYRGTTVGVRMFKEVEKELRARKVIKWINGCKVHNNHDHTRLFESLGFKLSEKIFTKILK